MAQTPQQKRANEAFAKQEAAKRGKPTTEVQKKKIVPAKSPISRLAVYFLLFVIVGGLLFELLRFVYGFAAQLFGPTYSAQSKPQPI